jgi:hypothetical protein
MDELIVYLCFTLHWTYPQAYNFVHKTPLKIVRAFVMELEYLKSVEDYRIASNSALIIATWANAQKKGNHYQTKDFVGKPPQRKGAPDNLKKAIEKANIKLPEK